MRGGRVDGKEPQVQLSLPHVIFHTHVLMTFFVFEI